VDINTQRPQANFEIKAESPGGGVTIVPIYKKRSLVGRGQACDVTVNFLDVSSIHAALEIVDAKKGIFKIYDLNSLNGTFLNDEKAVVGELKLDEPFRLGNNTFTVSHYNKIDMPPAPLKVLEDFPPIQTEIPTNEEIALPEQPSERISVSKTASMVYPLARDEDAEFSEYIFEDQDELYPIFKYHYEQAAVEVLITFGDHIQSVDFLPQKDGVYSLTGSNPKNLEIEYPYLGKKDKVAFIDIKGGIATVNPLNGYDVSSVGQDSRMNFHSSFNLLDDEIIRFTNGEIQIFVRKTVAPPKVASAPIFRRDSDLRKYLLLVLLFCFAVLIPLSLYEVDEELEKEKVPERIATILYKKKIYIPKKKEIVKRIQKPKKEAKSPVKPKPKIEPKPKKVVQVKPRKTKPVKQATKKSGIKTAKSAKLPRIAKPNKGPKNLKVSRVVPNPKPKASRAKAAPARTKISNARAKAVGRVDTYKSLDFKASVSSLLSKGGSTSKARVARAATTSGSSGGSSISNAASGATTETARVSNNIGSLTGVAKGSLDQTKGISGLVNKKSIYTAGLPYKTVVIGGLDPDVIRQILVANIPKFRTCYQSALSQAARAFNGIVKLNFIIGASGHVTKAGAAGGNSRLPSRVRGCVVNVLKGIPFPRPAGGAVVEVNQPMNFYPKVK
jgi:hypothetical protein